MPMMKVLVVGYGSIGRRHVRNLARLDCIEEIIIYTKIKDNFIESGREKIRFIDASTISLSKACENFKVKFAIIANQTYKHIDTAILLAEKGIDLFIEKPLFNNFEKADILEKNVKTMRIKIFLAYNLRFLPAIQYVKKQLSQKIIGDLYFARIEAGNYLPDWRANINYSESYSSKKELGGGVALDLSHEIDYMRYFFGEPLEWKTLKTKVSNLKIDSDDVFEGIYKYLNGFICNIHLDYLQRKPMRQIRVVGSKGHIICDLAQKWIEVDVGENKTRLTQENLFKTEDTYIDELQFFIKNMDLDKGSNTAIHDGIRSLKLLDDGNV